MTATSGPRVPLATWLGRIGASLKSGQYRDAQAMAVAAAALRPGTPMELVELARRLLYFNLSGAMRGVAKRLLERPLSNAAAEADVAAMLSMMGDQDQASRLLDRAMVVLGPHPAHLYNRSQMHLYAGRLAQSEADLRLCLAMEPGMAKAHWALSKLPAGANGTGDIQAARLTLSRVPPASQDEAFLRFALFNQLDRIGEHDQAWDELVHGCRAKRALLRYSPDDSSRLFEALRKVFPLSAAPPPTTGIGQGPTPIFIVGMHRSGTTLLERMVGNHSQVSEGGELYDFPAQLRLAVGRHFGGPLDVAVVEQANALDLASIGSRYLEQVQWRANGQPFLIDKLPSNFLNAGFIRHALPQARVIHMQRDPMDTCFSNLKELFSNACAYSYDTDELADYYAGYRSTMQHWREAAPGFVLDVRYEDLARDPAGQCRRILQFCGLPWEDGCLDVGGNQRAVNTASSAQVREPLHQRGIGAWRRYEPQLQGLRARLATHGIE
ncbi:MAG: sulfotransferase [Gammaproteobacteria bacterium]|nr:sulfotransferase [Gammaproteobacteria bacterium]